jgi:hypothetical protein
MKEQKRTPGDWTVGIKHPGRIIGQGKVLGYACQRPEYDGYPTDEERANALMFASAPKLLDALKEALREVEGFEKRTGVNQFVTWVSRARDAIAKAEGRE